MNWSFRAEETGLSGRHQRQMGSLRTSMMKEKEDELALFLEMRKREKELNSILLFDNSDELDTPLGQRSGSSPMFNIASTVPAPVRKTATEDFLNSDNDKNDYDWLLTPPGTPLFPSLEMEAQKTVMSQLGTPKARPLALKSRLANPQMEPAVRSSLPSRQPISSPGLTTSSAGIRRPSSSGGSRPSTPTGRPSISATYKPVPVLTSAPKPTVSASSKQSLTISRASSATISKPTRSGTPTSRASLPSTKPTVPPRSSTPTVRTTARSSTPTPRPTIPASKPASRSATPTRRPPTVSTTVTPVPPVKSPSSSTITKSDLSTVKNPVQPRSSSPTVKPRPWKPSDMPGFSLDAPPNLRTSLPDRLISASRGRPGAPTVRSSSVEPASNGRVRRQSCSPSRGRPPNGIIHSSGSSVPVPVAKRLHAKANDNVSPVLIGSKMVERVINMRKLVPPKQDDKHSPLSNLSGKSSSPDSSGFGRTLSKKSLDMAIRHMDIRRTIPGNLRPLMTNIPASSMYSVRSGSTKGRAAVSVSDSPIATSSNASSEVSVNNNNTHCVDASEIEDDISSDKVARSPASLRGR